MLVVYTNSDNHQNIIDLNFEKYLLNNFSLLLCFCIQFSYFILFCLSTVFMLNYLVIISTSCLYKIKIYSKTIHCCDRKIGKNDYHG